ncbi:non-specific lipid transfer protein GPI-anchored 30-like [Phoenix dactylifera]|uniref:Non-specific lipid transfer protein GPI-anchored 30-like n=1 Tax=Phoenix dactylifera TaxID=42345 RepID=A0A8B7CMQ6_PHODC|nr:non-specific lipid transfer protein GPI-anchored 30-like [Phoenix dactylifera]
MSSRVIVGAILLISAWGSMGVSLEDGDEAVLPGDTLPCLERLLPCQEYLNHEKPPQICCKVVGTVLAAVPRCFCTLFNNPEVVENLHTTREEALKLPDKCSYNNNLTSWCNNLTYVAKVESSSRKFPTVTEAPVPNGLTPTKAPTMHLMTGLTSLDVILGVSSVLLLILEV